MALLLGHTRTRIGGRHAVITPDAYAPNLSSGIAKGKVVTLVSPNLGASFLEVIIQFEGEEGSASFAETELETFIYILEGASTVDAGPAQVKRLSAGGYLFIPAGHPCSLTGPEKGTRLLVIQKKFRAALDIPPPRMIVGRSGQVQPQPYLGDPDIRSQPLLPEEPAYDMAVSLFTFQPGASFPAAAVHAVEHSLLLTQGQGIFRLEDSWYPVKEGDLIWVGSYCPQWFVATGKTAAQYLFFRESNRFPSLA